MCFGHRPISFFTHLYIIVLRLGLFLLEVLIGKAVNSVMRSIRSPPRIYLIEVFIQLQAKDSLYISMHMGNPVVAVDICMYTDKSCPQIYFIVLG